MGSDELDFRVKDSQRINRWKLFLSGEHDLGNGWGMNYGAVYTTSLDNSHQYYHDPDGGLLPVQGRSSGAERDHAGLYIYHVL